MNLVLYATRVFDIRAHLRQKSGLKWHTRVKRQISDFKIAAQVWHWQYYSKDAKSFQGSPTKFVASYLQPVVCIPLLHIALGEIFCLQAVNPLVLKAYIYAFTNPSI
ncbi:hypothetical protein PV326_005492 [Microctonus aethiopoides]|nr:hypothetical protein PV326_005492 [Microctonus aethiopoides]